MKLLTTILVTTLLVGCATQPKRPPLKLPPVPTVRRLPPRPPMLPMPTMTRSTFAPAAAIASTSVGIEGPINIDPEDPNLWVYFVYATQLATNELFIQQSGEPTFAGPVNGAIWSCYPMQQDVVAMFNARLFSTSFFRSLNVPCEWPPPFAPAAPTLPRVTLEAPLQALRYVNARGVMLKIGRELPLANGVRRFTLVPAK